MKKTFIVLLAVFFPATPLTAALPDNSLSHEEHRTVPAASEDEDKPDADITYPLDQLETGTQEVFPGVESEDDNWKNVIPASDPDAPEDDIEKIEE